MPEDMIRGSIGACGSGKTYGTQWQVAEHQAKHQRPDGTTTGWAHLVLDLNGEFPGEPARKLGVRRATVCRSVEEARASLFQGRAYVILRAQREHRIDTDGAPYVRVAEELAKMAIQGPPTVLVLPEIQTSAVEGRPTPQHIGEICHRYRHPSIRAGLLWDTQHFAEVRKDVVRSSTLLFFYANGGLESMRRIRQEGGPELVEKVEEASLLAMQGEPGWHVQLPALYRKPPYVLRRFGSEQVR